MHKHSTAADKYPVANFATSIYQCTRRDMRMITNDTIMLDERKTVYYNVLANACAGVYHGLVHNDGALADGSMRRNKSGFSRNYGNNIRVNAFQQLEQLYSNLR